MVASYSALGRFAKSQGVADIVDYYTGYYSNRSELEPSVWMGSGAKSLGLLGAVEAWQLRATLSGQHPTSGRQLVQIQKQKKKQKPDKGDRSAEDDPPNDDAPDSDTPASPAAKRRRKRRDRAPGFDICFTVPKSVSVLMAILPEAWRTKVIAAALSAVQSTLAMLESDVKLGRSRQGGWHHESVKLVISLFQHLVNRNGEPNLHFHSVISNMAQRKDGSWVCLNSKALRDWVRTLGPIFRCTLAAELRKLGLDLEPALKEDGERAGWFEVKGVPKSLTKKWSTRRAEIESLVAGLGAEPGDATAQARQKANVHSRQSKTPTPDPIDLFLQWQAEGRKHGLSPEQAVQLFGQAKNVEFEPRFQAAWKEALKQITEQESDFAERHVVQHVCEQLQEHGFSGIEIARRVRQNLERSPDIVRLREEKGERRYTTTEMWQLEEKLLSTADELRQSRGAYVSRRLLEKSLKQHTRLSDEQRVAVRQLLTDPSALRLLTGVAGAGKSSSLAAVRDTLEKAGYHVIGGALSGAAKEELAAKTGMPSRTVASYLYHLDKPLSQQVKDRVKRDMRNLARWLSGKSPYGPTKIKFTSRTVLVLDECSMLDTRTTLTLCQHIAKVQGTIIMAGDPAQLPPILAGGPFKHLVSKLGSAHLPTNLRQRHAQDQRAVADIRNGAAQEALHNYAERGRLTIGADRTDTIRRLVKTWAESGGIDNPQDNIVFTQTRREARVVNELCRQERQRFGAARSCASVEVAGMRLYVGDRVMFHEPMHEFGIHNGYRATIAAVSLLRRQITVTLDHAPPMTQGQKPRSQTVVIPLKKLQQRDRITLGYAATTHKLQGQTCQHAYMLLGGRLTSRELAYVQSSRGRETTQIFCDRLHAGEQLEDLVRSVEMSKSKRLAHDLGRRPERSDTKRRVSDKQRSALQIEREIG